MVYGPLASPGEPVEVDGVQATKWSVTPEAASDFASGIGADLPPEFFGDARAEYWVTANGQVIKVDIALPAGITAGGAPDGSVLMRLYDFGRPITIAPPEI